MQESFDHYFEEESLYKAINRFENMVKANTTCYFDVYEFEIIIDYYLDQHNFNHAETAIQIGICQHPSSSEIKFRLAQLYIQTGKPAKGLHLLRDVEKLEESNSDFYLLKGSALNLLGKKEETKQAFDKAIQYASEGKDDVIFNIAYSYITTRRYNLAIRYLKLAHQVNPMNTSVIHELALVSERMDNLSLSIEYYQKYLEIDPYNDNIWLSLGMAYSNIGAAQKAHEAYEYAIAIDPDNISALFAKANSLVAEGKNKEAIESYLEIVDLEPDNAQAYTYIGECYEKLEFFKRSIYYFERAIVIDDLCSDAWYGLGISNFQQELYTESVEYFRKASDIDPENADYWFMLGEVYRKLAMLEKSAEAFNRVIELDPTDHEAWICRAELSYKDNNDLKGAIRILTKAYEFNSNIPVINYMLGLYHLKNNQVKIGIKHFEKGLTLNFNEHSSFLSELSNKNLNLLNPIIKKYISKENS